MHHLRRCCPRHLDACQRAQGHVEKPTEAATQLLQTQARRVETSIILDWISCECRRATQQIRLTEGQKTSAKTRSEKNFQESFDDLQGTTATEQCKGGSQSFPRFANKCLPQRCGETPRGRRVQSGKKHVILIYNEIKSAFNNHMK